MVRITNGTMILKVPKSAFKTIYRASGFRLLEDEEGVFTPGDNLPTSDEKTPDTEIYNEETEDSEESEEGDYEETDDLSEIPLSEMDYYQLCDYADQLGLDRSGIRSKKELRILIKNAI